jgi:peptide/nickel transport system ATP-binding protein
MQSIPRIGGPGSERGGRLRQIDGTMPRLNEVPPGCPFNPRCPEAFERCRRERPDLLAAPETGAGFPARTEVACWLYDPA